MSYINANDLSYYEDNGTRTPGYIWQLETISGFLLVNILKTGEL